MELKKLSLRPIPTVRIGFPDDSLQIVNKTTSHALHSLRSHSIILSKIRLKQYPHILPFSTSNSRKEINPVNKEHVRSLSMNKVNIKRINSVEKLIQYLQPHRPRISNIIYNIKEIEKKDFSTDPLYLKASCININPPCFSQINKPYVPFLNKHVLKLKRDNTCLSKVGSLSEFSIMGNSCSNYVNTKRFSDAGKTLDYIKMPTNVLLQGSTLSSMHQYTTRLRNTMSLMR